MSRQLMLTARHVMTRRPLALRFDTSITDAIRFLLRHDISGVPVVDSAGELVGILSERDCLRVMAVGEYDAADEDRVHMVAEFMKPPKFTVSPEAGLYSLADFFLTHHERRLPVIERGKLIGLVCRRDVLKGIRKMIRKRQLPTPAEQRGPKLYPSAIDASADALGKRLD